MAKIEDGGPAFGRGNHEQGGASGMSLRDWFAGQALAGMLARDIAPPTFRDVADDAYLYADAMLAARKDKSDG